MLELNRRNRVSVLFFMYEVLSKSGRHLPEKQTRAAKGGILWGSLRETDRKRDIYPGWSATLPSTGATGKSVFTGNASAGLGRAAGKKLRDKEDCAFPRALDGIKTGLCGVLWGIKLKWGILEVPR